MMLQSLAGLAEREGLTESPAYEIKEVCWVVTVKTDGRMVSLESLIQEPTRPAAPVRRTTPARGRGLSTQVPRPPPGASGTGIAPHAGFLVGNASFSCGLDLTEEQKYAKRDGELERRLDQFTSLIRAAAQATADAGLQAVFRLLAEPKEVAKLQTEVSKRADSGEIQPNHLIGFRLDADDNPWVHARPQVVEYWARYRAEAEPTKGARQCLITGKRSIPVDKHPPIKGVPGGTPSGVAMVSFNSKAFESYGFDRNQNAPVSRQAAERYTTALNRLLNRAYPDPHDQNLRLPEQRVQLSDDTVAVFWTDEPSPIPSAISPAVGEGEPTAAAALGVTLDVGDTYDEVETKDVQRPDAAPLGAAHRAPWTGIRPEHLESADAFRLLILSGAQGRATVRAFHTQTVQSVVRAIRMWFGDIKLDSLRGKPGLRRLLASLAVRGESKHLRPNLAAEVFLCVLNGKPLPMVILEAAVRRCRSEPDSRQIHGRNVRGLKAGRPAAERIALIKAWLNRALRVARESHRAQVECSAYKEVDAAMNEEERNKGYLLGRVFACVERMQELALGEVGASVTDRYFSAACATPQAVFPRLLKTEVHHYRKAREGRWTSQARWLHRQIDQLAMWLVGAANGMAEGESIDAFLGRVSGRPLVGFPAFLPLPEQGLFALGYHQQRAEFFRAKGQDREDAVVTSDRT